MGEVAVAEAVEAAVIQAPTRDFKSLEAGKMGHTTREVGDLVVGYLASA